MITIKPEMIISDALEQAFELKKYISIINAVKGPEFEATEAFQKMYNGYFRVRQRSNIWYARYFELLKEQVHEERSFREILEALYPIEKTVEASFASKLIAVANPKMPIWDRFVLKNLGYESDWAKMRTADSAAKIEYADGVYQCIVDWYREFLASDNGRACIAVFDEALPNYKDLLSPTKKIDYILWTKR